MILSSLQLRFYIYIYKCYANLYIVVSLVMTPGSTPKEQTKTLFVFIDQSICL